MSETTIDLGTRLPYYNHVKIPKGLENKQVSSSCKNDGLQKNLTESLHNVSTSEKDTSIEDSDGYYDETSSFIDLYEDDDGKNELGDIVRDLSKKENIRNSIQVPMMRNIFPIKTMKTDSIEFDNYGFSISPLFSKEYYDNWWTQYDSYISKHETKWNQYFKKHDIKLDSNGIPESFPTEKTKELQNLVRGGMPPVWRGKAWWDFVNGEETLYRNRNYYGRLLAIVDDYEKRGLLFKNIPDADNIERDLNRTFPDNIHFQKEPFQVEEPLIVKKLRNILTAFSIYKPQIGYCQSMNFLAGLLLLFLDEERAFWMLVIITQRFLPGVHDISLEGINVDQGVLLLCLNKYTPDIWRWILNYSNLGISGNELSSKPELELNLLNDSLTILPPISLCTANWFMSSFIGTVPIETTLRIWDCLFFEGPHILFRMSLGIFEMIKDTITKKDVSVKTGKRRIDDELIMHYIQTYPKKILDVNNFFNKIIFRWRCPFDKLSEADIIRFRRYATYQREIFKNPVHIGNSDTSREDDDDEDFTQIIEVDNIKERRSFGHGIKIRYNNIKQKYSYRSIGKR